MCGRLAAMASPPPRSLAAAYGLDSAASTPVYRDGDLDIREGTGLASTARSSA